MSKLTMELASTFPLEGNMPAPIIVPIVVGTVAVGVGARHVLNRTWDKARTGDEKSLKILEGIRRTPAGKRILKRVSSNREHRRVKKIERLEKKLEELR